MKTRIPTFIITLAMVMILIAASSSLTAQSIWLYNSNNKTISFEAFKPFFDAEGYTFFTGAYFLSFRFPIGKSLLVAELPYVYGAYNVETFYGNMSESEGSIGNPYIGLQSRISNSSTFGEVGFRLPLTSDDKRLANYIGRNFSDLDRMEGFVPNCLPIMAMLNYQNNSNPGPVFRLRGGPVLWINTDKDEYEDSIELWLKYSAQIGYESEQLCFLVGLVGQLLVTEGDLDFSERTVHQLGISNSIGFGKIRPGIVILLPLDEEIREVMNYLLGVNVEIALP